MSETGAGEIEIDIDMSASKPEPEPIVMESIAPQAEPGDSKEKEAGLDEIIEPEVIVRSDKVESDKKKPKSSVNVFKLFRYATPLDIFLMIVGSVAALAHGAALPLLMFVFSDLTNSFLSVGISRAVVPPLNNGTLNCSASIDPIFINQSAGTLFNDTIPCDNYIIMDNSTFDSLLPECLRVPCVDFADFENQVNFQVIYFVIIAVSVFVVANFQISCFQLACERQVQKIRLLYYRAILKQEIGWFDANPSGELASRLSDDMQKIHDGIGDKVALLLQWSATFVGGFVIGFIRDWRLTLLLTVFAPFLAIGGFLMTKLISSFTSQEQKEYASAGAVAEEVLVAVRTVISFGAEYVEADRYDKKLKQARLVGLKKGVGVGISFGLVYGLIFIVESAAFWFGGYLISVGLTQGGDVVGVFFAVLIGAFAIGQASPFVQTLLTAAGAAESIYNTIDRTPLIDSSSDRGLTPETFDSTIELRNVCFSYPTRPDCQVLDRFSIRVDVGKTFALVGPSGCGKSTTVGLIQRFYDVDDGEVLVGGVNVKDLNLKWLRKNIGVVSQEPVLFDTTIAENIRYGREDATLDDIKKAAKNANAHDFISQLPDGYNTLVGERGTQLSGGQKQRVAIARALVRDPKILLLDEATSALDTESESIVQKALDKAREGRTTIVIAHRLSTIQTADVIVSVQDGRVVENGTHAELMDKEGLYFDLVTAQSYAADEQFSLTEALSPKKGSIRRRKRTNSTGSDDGLARQTSLAKQNSTIEEVAFKRMSSKQKQEEWDKEIPDVSVLRVMALNAKEWWIIILGLLAALINGSIWPLFALFFGEILNVYQRPPDQVLEGSHLWGGLFILLAIVSALSIFVKSVAFSVSGENLTSRLRSRSFRAILRQNIGWFDDERNSSGALVTRLALDAAQVQGVAGVRLGNLLETFFGMLLALVISLAYNWILSLIIIGVIPLIVIGGALEAKILIGNSKNKDVETAGKIAVDSIDNIRTVASLGIEENFHNQYSSALSRPYKKAVCASFLHGFTYAFSQSVIYVMYVVVFRFGAWQVALPVGHIARSSFSSVFVSFSALVFGAAGAGQAGAFAPDYARAKQSTNRIFHLLNRVPEIDNYSEDGETPGAKTVTGTVSVNKVTFNYPTRPDVKVLQGLSIEVKPGQTLALVGPSGCGKSTVVSLLERFYDPLSGSLTMDGTDIRDLNIRWLRQQIGVVSQEPVLMDSSIADNIRYGANFREVSDEEVIEAAKAANIHKFVESLPDGYNTNVGAKGTQLSGGQKQRVAIARAIIRDPKILLLDEATSALDTESEKIVQDALDKAQKGRTSIVIAHRLSTIYGADCIVVIKGGEAVEVGTHSELLEKKGIYYKLNRYQMIEKKPEK